MKLQSLQVEGVTYADNMMTVKVTAFLMGDDGLVTKVYDVLKLPIYDHANKWQAVFVALGELYQRFPCA